MAAATTKPYETNIPDYRGTKMQDISGLLSNGSIIDEFSGHPSPNHIDLVKFPLQDGVPISDTGQMKWTVECVEMPYDSLETVHIAVSILLI